MNKSLMCLLFLSCISFAQKGKGYLEIKQVRDFQEIRIQGGQQDSNTQYDLINIDKIPNFIDNRPIQFVLDNNGGSPGSARYIAIEIGKLAERMYSVTLKPLTVKIEKAHPTIDSIWRFSRVA